MAIISIFLSLLAFSVHIVAANVVRLDFERREVLDDQQPDVLRRSTDTESVYNSEGSLLYLINVTVGTPPQKLQLQLDTGSSDIWIPWVRSLQCAQQFLCTDDGSYDETKSSTYTLVQSSTFSISYVDGSRIRGDYVADTFDMGSVSIPQMIMGLAKTAQEPENIQTFQGIMGIGLEANEAINAQSGTTYDNLVTRLKNSGAINTRAYSLWLNDKGW